ncbi:MAG: hypothetical protein LBO74_08460 [Candidatus Symbiothrix sp.]|jgi:hypothetical protein|nr:hypothetical protein [Candidatus Symbiothrix sp.]
MATVLSISASLFVAYLVVLIALFGVPASISDSFYLLGGKKKGAGYVFTIWCYIVGISVMAMMFELSAGFWYQFLGLFAGGGLCFVGTAPLFKSHEKTIHFASAAVCAITSLLWIIFAGYWLILLLITSLSVGILSIKGNPTFWIEASLFASMYFTLFWML